MAGSGWPAAALVGALKGRTVIDVSCDAEGTDDVRLRLDYGKVILIDADLVDSPAPLGELLGPASRAQIAAHAS